MLVNLNFRMLDYQLYPLDIFSITHDQWAQKHIVKTSQNEENIIMFCCIPKRIKEEYQKAPKIVCTCDTAKWWRNLHFNPPKEEKLNPILTITLILSLKQNLNLNLILTLNLNLILWCLWARTKTNEGGPRFKIARNYENYENVMLYLVM